MPKKSVAAPAAKRAPRKRTSKPAAAQHDNKTACGAWLIVPKEDGSGFTQIPNPEYR